MKHSHAYALLTAVMAAATLTTAAYERSHDAAVARNLTTFNNIIKEIELNYVDTIRTDEAFTTAIDALLATIDPYTEYYDSDDREALATMTTGEYGGIGSYIMERDSSTYISEPYKDSPAAVAGLRAGDRIVRVDSVSVAGMRSDAVTKLLRGQPGTDVVVRVERPYTSDSLLDITVSRRKLQLPSVPYHTVTPGGTGYLRLTSFIDKSADEVRDVLEEFKANPDFKNLVLDLRGNGGGLLESAVDILGNFLPKGTEVLRTRGRDRKDEKIYKTTRTPMMPDVPMAVLIDGGSASAAEITAGALQDLDRAVLLGSRSYGKGLVQSTRPLPYDGLLKVTIAKYYIPSGRLIQALDYSRRNPDGSVARTPDSLTNEYSTRAGRKVRDGGGLTPDITIEWEQPSQLLYSLVRDNKVFDYATRFAARNPSIAPADRFTVTDSVYEDFKLSVDPAFKYDKVCSQLIDKLRETVDREGYTSPGVTEHLDSLTALLDHDLYSDMERRRPEIERYLAEEIVSRYYYGPGKIAVGLRTDPGLRMAEEILSDPARYRSLLSPPSEK